LTTPETVELPVFCHPISGRPVDRGAAFGHDPRMKSSDVTRRQALIVKKQLEPTRDYLIKLHQRMSKRGFDADDELMALVIAANLAIQNLCNDLTIRTREGPTAPPAEPPTIGKSKRALEIRDRQQGRW
jgi:hypothetical protein